MAESKIHPPSASRVEEARHAGLAPRPVLVGLAGAFAAATGCVYLLGPSVSASLLRLLREPLSACAAGDVGQALVAALAALRQLALHGALLALALFVGCVVALLVAQGPSAGWPRAGRARFDEPKPVRGLPLLSGAVLLLLSGSMLQDVFWAEPSSLGELLRALLMRLALGLAALGLIDALFARAAFFRALWLTRQEQRSELREAYGSPELRAARERIRREQGRGQAA